MRAHGEIVLKAGLRGRRDPFWPGWRSPQRPRPGRQSARARPTTSGIVARKAGWSYVPTTSSKRRAWDSRCGPAVPPTGRTLDRPRRAIRSRRAWIMRLDRRNAAWNPAADNGTVGWCRGVERRGKDGHVRRRETSVPVKPPRATVQNLLQKYGTSRSAPRGDRQWALTWRGGMSGLQPGQVRQHRPDRAGRREDRQLRDPRDVAHGRHVDVHSVGDAKITYQTKSSNFPPPGRRPDRVRPRLRHGVGATSLKVYIDNVS